MTNLATYRCIVVRNGDNWDRFEPRTKNSEKQNLNILDFAVCPRFKSVQGSLHFPLL